MELQVFKNERFGELRTVEIDNDVWFVGKDVADKLGYANQNEALQNHVDDEDKLNSKSLSSFDLNLGQRGGWLINESGLYSLVLSSKLPKAKQFKRWVTSEVLPSIRKHGAYMTNQTLEQALTSPDFLIKLAIELKSEQEKNVKLQQTLTEQKPKVVFAEAVDASQTSILVGNLAKMIKQNGYDIGQKRLFEWLRQNGYLIKRKSNDWNMPTQKSMDLGLFEIKESTHLNPDGSIRTTRTPKVTGKGQIYFINKFFIKKGVINH